MEAINREMAIIRGNTVLTNFKFPFFRSLCRKQKDFRSRNI